MQTSDAFACAMVHKEIMDAIIVHLLGTAMEQHGKYTSSVGIFGKLESLSSFIEEQVRNKT
jgi:hypothetical protein